MCEEKVWIGISSIGTLARRMISIIVTVSIVEDNNLIDTEDGKRASDLAC